MGRGTIHTYIDPSTFIYTITKSSGAMRRSLVMPHEGEGLLAALLQQPFAWRIVRLTRTGHCLRLGRYQSTSTQAFRSTILSRDKKHRTTCTL